ncbi:MAG: transcription-repair coupling factor [Bacteroidetes bacterium RIFOXYA12_FULL_35_11]|nr:MAG: transcription-repair coupling factor [Bacteroidetes bacterium GWF2_35_48]OFY73988.1 MAG: transcription-repair coupling factor [Bacteroidetes bacterium RIFOXYA12_FULL_35_11]OFY95973.1 MAG: transcription-repair coupling factor [Bacteroidetes bacterium RIFOXYB2_FULL_35_7]OFZ00093.1 MAG: transcription-repair coupling factor [Bacteroidetes bacterium RIFOXYC12_FULL_35_7]HBX52109.1 transcription-repair coupling factor [Bacteroidales bacterium]
MTNNNFIEKYQKHPLCIKLTETLQRDSVRVQIKGLAGSAPALIVGSVFNSTGLHLLTILNDKEDAAYFYNDLLNFFPSDKVLFFPSSYKKYIDPERSDPSAIVSRTEVLNKCNEENPVIVVSYPEAVAEKVITRSNLEKNTLKIKVGEKINLDFLLEVLFEYEFTRADFVYEPGQFAVRGSIIDVFSFSSDFPYRIDFFGDEVDSIRTFNLETQLSIEKVASISIIPEFKGALLQESRISFLEFLPQSTIIWAKDLRYAREKTQCFYEDSIIYYEKNFDTNKPDAEKIISEMLVPGNYLFNPELKNKTIECSSLSMFQETVEISFKTSHQPAFNKNFDLLISNLLEYQSLGYRLFILSDNEKQIERIGNIFSDKNAKINFTPSGITLHEGFIDNDLLLCCYTDHQIFDRFHKFRVKSNFISKETLTLNELHNLHPGDYVVHIDHGIGIFGGLEKMEIGGKLQEAIRLVYKDKDVLYVNIHQLHKISKYKSREGDAPKIYKLGTGAWQKLKQNTKSKIKDIAKELIALYAKRREQPGFEYAPDTYLQEELEASFIYEDTPDQEKATRDVKKDMESDYPMDRLICGDVGFGKTEIAVRAAFKAATDGKQVAVLVPTTILALQHYKTFSDRLKNFPCTVDYVSRLKTSKAIKETLKKAEEGKIEILIGTHRLLSQDVKFKDLGLLVIDEEQKFGVAAKEKLKTYKLNIDTLTLTATPIPRTLQFSLMGARDLSVITTPPANRFPIVTELHSFNEDIIKEAIYYEVERGGQVFFIHNRVQNIQEVQQLLKKLCPDVKSIVAHGQMEGTELENIMLEFMSGDYEILIATTIIESGIDIPNANTIIINNAQNFGLSDLHQLRGRVGRSNKKAFCYLLAPPPTAITQEARRRLKAIEDFTELGSGFNISLQDLDIRGAGNILGGEQSGYIADIGFETYHKILNEAIEELKETDFKNLFSSKQKNEEQNEEEEIITEPLQLRTDCQIETDMEILFPEIYIENVAERIKLYRELDNIETEDALLEFQKKIEDRFGKMPKQTEELLNVVRLRRMAVKSGFEKVLLRNKIMTGYFISNQESLFYKTSVFQKILQSVQMFPLLFKMKELKEKLILTVENIKTITEAMGVLKKLTGEV